MNYNVTEGKYDRKRIAKDASPIQDGQTEIFTENSARSKSQTEVTIPDKCNDEVKRVYNLNVPTMQIELEN